MRFDVEICGEEGTETCGIKYSTCDRAKNNNYASAPFPSCRLGSFFCLSYRLLHGEGNFPSTANKSNVIARVDL
jgi:hypothetical protein